jgi:hypothetical protein
MGDYQCETGIESAGTSEIIDGNVTSVKASASFIQDLPGLQVISSTQTVGNPSSGFVCPYGQDNVYLTAAYVNSSAL